MQWNFQLLLVWSSVSVEKYYNDSYKIFKLDGTPLCIIRKIANIKRFQTVQNLVITDFRSSYNS